MAVTKGSEAQIKWATDLINIEVARIDKMLAPIPPKDQRSEISQKLYGEQIAFVKKLRNTLADQVQSAKWVIENRNNLVYAIADLLRKKDSAFAARFDDSLIFSVIPVVNDGTWLKGAGF